jgi:hypothetical protein
MINTASLVVVRNRLTMDTEASVEKKQQLAGRIFTTEHTEAKGSKPLRSSVRFANLLFSVSSVVKSRTFQIL